MEIGTNVKVNNPDQINYNLKGIVIEKEISPNEINMSKVKFKYVECWYDDKDLKEVK
jgi:hypothetical protein